MSEAWVLLLLLHAAILAVGSALLWASGRRPGAAAVGCGLLVAAGGWAFRAGGDAIAAGPEAGQRLLRLGQWAVALGVAGWWFLVLLRRDRGSIPLAGWTDRAKALAAYWFLCFVVALVEGVVIFLGTTPHGEFR